MIWVLAQNGKMMMYCSKFEVTKVIGGKNKASIVATGCGYNCVAIGAYENEDKARDELDNIISFIESGEKGIYRVR